MTQVQLPPKFQSHPEVAAGAVTLDQAIMMIRLGWLTYDGACYLLPPRAWDLLPKPAPQAGRAERVQIRGWLHRLKNWRAA